MQFGLTEEQELLQETVRGFVAGECHVPFARVEDDKQVAAFEPPDNPTVLGYQKAVTERTLGYIHSLSSADLDRELGGPWTPTPTVGVRLVSILEDAVIHAGQAAYVRGLLQGRGWQPY